MNQAEPMNELRIDIFDLQPRDEHASESVLRQALKRLGAEEGQRCELSCDCSLGLICSDGTCTPDW